MKHKLQLLFASLIVVAVLVWAGVFSNYKADTSEKNLKVYFLDVGQGDSQYIKTPDGNDILIDGGPDDSVLTELGKVMDFGDREISLVVLTHPHADHLNGLVSVLRRYKVQEIWESGVDYPSAAYTAFAQIISQEKIKDEFVKVGKTRSFGEVKISVLSPLLDLKNTKMDNVNNASVVTQLDYRGFSSLFLADLEKNSQTQILNQIKPTNVVKVGHHGSQNALNEDLYKIARPNIAVIEVGAKNTYGHPHQITIDYLKSIAAQIYRTDQNKTIEINSDGLNYWVKTGL
ncbi:MAG: MBL fold metallo-hydrolase [Candidatus Berkelbacteria bacterium]